MGKFDHLWEMKEKTPTGSQEVFKCTRCNASHYHEKGHSGEPDLSSCKKGCRDKTMSEMGDWHPGMVSEAYQKNYDLIKWKK